MTRNQLFQLNCIIIFINMIKMDCKGIHEENLLCSFICSSQGCYESPYMCLDVNCQCFISHQYCNCIKFQMLIKKLDQNNNKYRNKFEIILEKIENKISKVVQLKNLLIKKFELHIGGFIKQFLSKLQQQNFKQITGDFVYKLNNQLENKTQLDLFDCRLKLVQLTEITKSINQCFNEFNRFNIHKVTQEKYDSSKSTKVIQKIESNHIINQQQTLKDKISIQNEQNNIMVNEIVTTNNINKNNEITENEKMSQINHMNHMEQMNQINQMNQKNQMNQINQINQPKQTQQKNKIDKANQIIHQINKIKQQNVQINQQKIIFKFSPFFWSNSLKSKSILIQNDIIRQTYYQQDSQQNTFIMLQPKIDNPSIICFKFLHLVKQVYIGVGFKTTIAKNRYGFDQFQSVGHGAYLFGSAGVSYSSHDRFYNNVMLAPHFILETNDQICMKINLERKSLKIYKINTFRLELITQLQIRKTSGKCLVHPLVYIRGNGSSVKIIDQSELFASQISKLLNE